MGSPFFCGMVTAAISSLKRPASCAAAALVCDASASASCCSRVMPYFLATFSAVMPMWYWLYTSHRPSTIIESTIFQSPIRWPSRELGSTWGAALMFSWPPAITISLSPAATACAASMTALRPEPHTALMVRPGVWLSSPAFSTVWRAGFWPEPAVSTWPMMTSPIWSADRPVRASRSLMTTAPRSGAAIFARLPPNLPTAVRLAATMTISSMNDSCLNLRWRVGYTETRARHTRPGKYRKDKRGGACQDFCLT